METEEANIHLQDPTTGSYAKQVELFPHPHIYICKISLLQLHSTPNLPVLTLPLRFSRYNDASTFHFLGLATCSTYLIRPGWIAVVKMCNNKVTKPLVKQFPSSSCYFSLFNLQILCAATTL